MTWHAEAEQWAYQTVQAAATGQVVFLTPELGAATSGLVTYVGPADMTDTELRHSGAVTADMTVPVTVRAGGTRPADLEAMTAETDAIIAALARGGARAITTDAGVMATNDTRDVPARTITTTVSVEGVC
jgi:hypothetical protein